MRATETIDFERELPELVRELRSLPAAAPESVRQRVRALGEPSRPRVLVLRDRLASMRWRRTLLVLAPVCVAGVLGAALVHGLVSSGPSRQTAVWGAATSPSATHDKSLSLPEDRPVFSGAADSRRVIPQPSSGRYQDYEASLTVRVRDLDTLSDRTTEAMQAVRSLGGYVASVEQTTTAGRPGRADLVLRVPVARVQDAIARLAGLGTVTEQHLSIRDLNQLVAQQRQQILTLKLQIARLVNALRDSSLPADVRIRLQFQLDQARRNLSAATGRNKATLREAALSRVALTLTTQQPVAATSKSHTGRAERAARDAASFLAAAGVVVLYLLIVLSPLLALSAFWAWGRRSFRRREAQRLLA